MNQEFCAKILKAKSRKKQNKKLFDKLAKYQKNKLDAIFQKEHEIVFEEIDCLECANCCKTTSPIFRDADIRRISAHLKIKDVDFIDNYLKIDADNDYVLKTSPCTFLKEDNTCEIYDNRPLACREYPHTNRKHIHQIKSLTIKNSELCPAVAQIFDNLNVKYNK